VPNDRIVAYHEAGHALAAHALARPIDSVTLTESGGEFREYEVAAWEPTTAER
jgi:ATP-dependent Zn protease